MVPKNKKMIVFDLDGTLAPSKAEIDSEMAELLVELLKKYKVSVVTGGDYERFDKQIFQFIGDDENILKNFYACPTCGTKMYVYKDGNWTKLYSEDLTEKEVEYILNTLNEAIDTLGLRPEKTYGELVENRGTQITYSALGQQAPLEVKSVFDPDFKKRLKIKEYLDPRLEGFSALVAGTSSIDITREGLDKAYALKKLEKESGIAIGDMLFIGDALMEGGNDFPVLKTGIDALQTKDPEETKKMIRGLVK
ncbi:MAG: HAD-IIB family hydrolase [Candidatus Gracilibacteria bacterium]|nr:HAD-IIB family hydrolase [Candidatus Gracilibacteria bacterium]MDD4531032.1 HAD-IIB family hydrolase [Candidatus Gracilibacteria bacterium]